MFIVEIHIICTSHAVCLNHRSHCSGPVLVALALTVLSWQE